MSGDDFAGVIGPDIPEVTMWTVAERLDECVTGLVFDSQCFLSLPAFISCTTPSTERYTTADQANGAFSEYVAADAELQVFRRSSAARRGSSNRPAVPIFA